MGKLLKKIPMEDIPDGYYMIHWTKEGSILRDAINAVIDAWNEEYAQSEKHIQEPTVPTQAPEEPAILTRWIDPTINEQKIKILKLENIIEKIQNELTTTYMEQKDNEDSANYWVAQYCRDVLKKIQKWEEEK